MKNIKLTQKGKRFFTGLMAVGFVGLIGLGNLNNNHDEVVYIDEFQTVYASDIEETGTDDLQAHKKDLQRLDVVSVADKEFTGYEVTHVYEDGCIDIIEPVDGEYKFYCEAEFK